MYITISNTQISDMKYEADSFCDTFFDVYASYQNNGQFDMMSVLGTIGSFSIELYLKLICVIESFNISTCSGQFERTHDLSVLYTNIGNGNSVFGQQIDSNFNDLNTRICPQVAQKMTDFLASIRASFLEWRYSFSSGDISTNLNLMSNAINALSEFINAQYISVADAISRSPNYPQGSTTPSQTMSICNKSQIRKL
jgi:hypothetical protein